MRTAVWVLGLVAASLAPLPSLATGQVSGAQATLRGRRDRHALHPRASASSSTTSTSTSSAASASSASSSSSSSPNVPLAPSEPPSTPPSPVPSPLDITISYALSDACLIYLGTLIKSPEFISCLPFSLLLSTSSSYSSLLSDSLASANLTTLNELVAYAASPALGSDTCDAYMASVATDLSAKGNCAADIRNKVPVALDIWRGVGNDAVMRAAAGLEDAQGRYCYLDAVASSGPDDLYLWSLPAGAALPSTSTPTCSACSRLLLNLYTSSMSNTTTLNQTLVTNAVNRVNAQCGQSFVSYSTSSSSSSAAPRLVPPLAAFSWLAAVLPLLLFTCLRTLL